MRSRGKRTALRSCDVFIVGQRFVVGVEAVPNQKEFRNGWKTRLRSLEVFDRIEGLLAEDMVVVEEERS